jgi:hypothetical protein
MTQGMSGGLTANSLTGRAIGMIFFAAFGAGWIVMGLYGAGQLGVVPVLMVAACTMVLLAGAAYLSREAERFPLVAKDPKQGRIFAWVNLVQWIAVGVVAVSFARLHLDNYVVNAITAIVGLHMLPLARLFRYTPHYVSGVAMVVWAVASIWLAPAESLQSVTAIGTGLLLWLSAAATLGLAMARARRAPVEMACQVCEASWRQDWDSLPALAARAA